MSTRYNYMDTRAQSAPELSRDRLDSWKEIAVYLDREVRTVQRWEKREGLPVHRQFHVKAGTVWALKRDIDAWFNNRRQVVSKAAPEGRLLERSVSWSGPASLDAKGSGQSSWVWSTVPLDSHGLDSPLGVAENDGRLISRKIRARAQGSRMANRDIGPSSHVVACACTKCTITLLRVSVSFRRMPGVFRTDCPRNAVDAIRQVGEEL
jgi:hypothetical protein